MSEFTDEKLVIASCSGQKDAFAHLVRRHYSRVFAVCMAMTKNNHDAEDIAQDAMLKGLSKIKTLRDGEQFGPWIVQIARNLCLDLFRKQKRSKTLLREHADKSARPGKSEIGLEDAIRKLPQEIRLPLVMFYFDGKNALNVAEKLGVSHSTACARIRTARKQLHRILTEQGGIS